MVFYLLFLGNVTIWWYRQHVEGNPPYLPEEKGK